MESFAFLQENLQFLALTTSFRSENLGQNDVPSLIFCLALSLLGPTNRHLVHLLAQNNAAKHSTPATERPKVSHRLQSNPQVAEGNPQVDSQVAQSMLKVPQGRPQAAPSNPRVAQSNRQVGQRSSQMAQMSPWFTLCYGWRVGIVHSKCHK